MVQQWQPLCNHCSPLGFANYLLINHRAYCGNLKWAFDLTWVSSVQASLNGTKILFMAKLSSSFQPLFCGSQVFLYNINSGQVVNSGTS